MTKSDSRKRSSEVIFEELALAILGGQLKPGTPLESERTLGVRFAASRSTIREAVHKLGDAGLVRVSQGAPTVVLDAEKSIDPRVLALRYRVDGPREKRELAERRMLGGISLIYLASLRAKPEEIDALSAELEAYAARGALPEELAALDEKLWIGIARITDNTIFAREVAWWFRGGSSGPPSEGDTPPSSRVAFYRELLRRMKTKDRAASFYLDVMSVMLPT